MSIIAVCPNCGKIYKNISQENIGKKARCKDCSNVFEIMPLREKEADELLIGGDMQPLNTGGAKAEQDSTDIKDAEKTDESTVPVDWNEGDVILNVYKVFRLLGEGGMGKVHLIKHLDWDVELAVKSPKPEELAKAGGVETFIRESETWVKLGMHPNIVSCYYVREMGGIPRVFAEFIEGGSLQDWIRGGKLLTLEKILDVAIQFAWGLHYSHSKGLVHQDVKPANVMMTKDGVAKVTDFGLATVHIVDGSKKSKGVDPQGMTLLYCSPEQADNLPLTPKTDMWSWGVSMLEMFIGEITWPSGSVAADVLSWYLDDGPVNKDLPLMPKRLVSLLELIFKENISERPSDMLAVANEVIAIYEEEVGRKYHRELPEVGMTNANSINNRAVSLLDLGKTADAINLLSETLRIFPYHPESSYNRSILLWRAGIISDVALIEEMEEVLQSNHDEESRVRYLTAQIHLERDDYLKVEETLKGIPDPGVETASAFKAAAAIKGHNRRLINTFDGHDGAVNSLCLSLDGKILFSGGQDMTVKLWHIASGTRLNTLSDHQAAVTSVYLSKDGKYLLSAGLDKKVNVWNIAKGVPLYRLKGYTDEVTAVVTTPDVKYAITGSVDRSVKLWHIQDEKYLRVYNGHRDVVTSVVVNKTGTVIVSGSKDGTVRLWDLETTRGIETMREHTAAVNSVSICSRGRFVLSGSSDKTARFWDVKAAKCLCVLKDHTDAVNAVALTSDGRFGLTGGRDKKLKLWEIVTNRCLRTFEGHEGEILSITLSRDGKYALTGDSLGKIFYWQVDCFKTTFEAPRMLTPVIKSEEAISAEVAVIKGLKAAEKSIAAGNVLEAIEHLKYARNQHGFNRRREVIDAWNSLYEKTPLKGFLGAWKDMTLSEHTDEVTSISLSEDNRTLFSGSMDGTTRLWDVPSGVSTTTFRGSKDGVISSGMNGSGKAAITLGVDNVVKIWDTANKHATKTLPSHTEPLTSVDINIDGSVALTGGTDKMVRTWDTDKAKFIRSYEGAKEIVNVVRFSPNSQLIAAGCKDGSIVIWQTSAEGTAGRGAVLSGHKSQVLGIQFSRDGRYLVSGSEDCTIKLWDIKGAKCIGTFERHTEPVVAVDITKDGRYILSGSNDYTARLWDTASGDCLKVFHGHTSSVRNVLISSDNRFFLTTSGNSVMLWLVDWDI